MYPKKVIHIFNELKFSGAEIMYVDAAPIFRQSGCELSAVNTARNLGEYACYFEEAGYKVFHKPYPSSKNPIQRLRYCFNFILFLKKEAYDIVHIHSQHMMWTMALCSRLANIRSIYTVHNVFSAKRIYIYLYRYLSRWSAKHIFRCTFQTISDSVYNNEKEYYCNTTIKINNWYASNRFYPADNNEKETFRKSLGIADDALVLISVGGCSKVKRHTDIIKALPAVTNKYPNAVYLHLGEGVSLHEEQLLAEELHVADHVVFCGNQKNVREYLTISDIYVMTSMYEGISITTIEAMACNIPAILYNVPGLKDFNAERECALLIPENTSILAESIIMLYENAEKRQNLIKTALHFVESQFDMKTNASKILELYQTTA